MKQIKVYVYKNGGGTIYQFDRMLDADRNDYTFLGRQIVEVEETEEKRDRENWYIDISPEYEEPHARLVRINESDIKTIELREGEIIVSEQEVRAKLNRIFQSLTIDTFCNILFKKDGK